MGGSWWIKELELFELMVILILQGVFSSSVSAPSLSLVTVSVMADLSRFCFCLCWRHDGDDGGDVDSVRKAAFEGYNWLDAKNLGTWNCTFLAVVLNIMFLFSQKCVYCKQVVCVCDRVYNSCQFYANGREMGMNWCDVCLLDEKLKVMSAM